MKRSTRSNRLKQLPPLPTRVHSALGPIPVELVKELKDDDGTSLMGKWIPDRRAIQIRAAMHRTAEWHTLFHERTHVALWDAGFTQDQAANRVIEHVCDAIATARVAEMLNR